MIDLDAMRINVVIGGELPGLMQDIIRRIAVAESDLQVFEARLSTKELLDHVEKYSIDAVVVGCDKSVMDEIGHALLERTRRARVIAVVPDSGDAVLFSLIPTQRPLGQLSMESLIEAIRSTPFSDGIPVQ